MKKILVSAYGCEPFRGSEAGVGWNWILQMAKENELFIITRANDREKIEANIPESLKANLHFHFYDTSAILQKLKKREKGLYLYYFLWQTGIITIIKKVISECDPDYTMHLTFGSIWMPTFLPFFKPPFIWGPLGGGDCVPKDFLKTLPIKQRIVQSFRYFLISSSFLNPIVSIPSKKAIKILCRTENNVKAIPKKYRWKSQVILETSIEDSVFSFEKTHNNKSSSVQLVITGRLVPFKNVIMIIRTIRILKDKHHSIHLTIIGDGPDRNRILNLIERLDLSDNITLINTLQRSEVLRHLEQSDIFVFPSLREAGAWSLMEAMAVGLPVVCFDWSGMSIITDNNCALRIKPIEPNEAIISFSNAIEKLVLNVSLREQLGRNGRLRIKEKFSWEQKGIFMNELLENINRDSRGIS